MSEITKKQIAIYEPLRNNRFTITTPKELGLEVWEFQTISFPKFVSAVIERPFLNTNTYIAGKFHWEQITIKLVSNISSCTNAKVLAWSEKHSANFGKPDSEKYTDDIFVDMLDPTSVSVSRWLLKDCMIVSTDFGDGDYADDKLNLITVVVQPRICVLQY